MTIFNRYPEFFKTCKQVFPHGNLDFSEIDNKEIDKFVISYMNDLGGDTAKAAFHLMMTPTEEALEDAYSACRLELDKLAQKYNDYCDLERENQRQYLTEERFDTKYTASYQAMLDAGHKESDF